VFLLLATKASVTTLTYTLCQVEFAVQLFLGWQTGLDSKRILGEEDLPIAWGIGGRLVLRLPVALEDWS